MIAMTPKRLLHVLGLFVWLAGWPHARANEPLNDAQSPGAPAVQSTTREQVDMWMATLSNKGRWGTADRRGTLNLITPAKRKAALGLVRLGTAMSLARDVFGQQGFQLQFAITDDGTAGETHTIRYHNTASTHLDSLCHVSHDEKLYNEVPFRDEVSNEGGCATLGVGILMEGIVTRAVLLDIPRLKGQEYLDPGTAVHRADLEAWEKRANIRISSGDAILLRTGRWAHLAKFGPSQKLSGYDPDIAPMLKERDVAVLGADGNGDVNARGDVPGTRRPIKQIALATLGMPILNGLDLEALAETAARLKRWEFLLIVSPTPISRSSGSSINPIAMF